MSTPPRFRPTAITPTPQQTAIQTAHDRLVLVEANAGAAKTTTLALRIGEALAHGLPPEGILALAFTTEARDVLRQRLLELGVAPALAERVRVQTFEELAESVLRAAEGMPTPRLTSAAELRPHVLRAIEATSERYAGQYAALEIATHSLAISQFIDAQLQAKARMLAERDWEDSGDEEIAEQAGLPLTQWLTLRQYELQRRGMLDEPAWRGPFDATYDLARYLDDRPETADYLPAVRLLLCDELHDMNEAAFRLLTALLLRGQAYFVGAGDKDQVIHATLGADAAFLRDRFEQRFGQVQRLPLSASYRHGPYLALASGKFKRKTADSGISRDTRIVCRDYQDSDPEQSWDDGARQVVAAIRHWQKDQGPQAGTSAILIRDSHQSIAIENALLEADLPYRCQGVTPYLQRPEILFMRGMLAIALNNLGSVPQAGVRGAIVEALVTFAGVDLSNTYFLEGQDRLDHAKALEKTKKTIADDPTVLVDFFTGQFKPGLSPEVDRCLATIAWLRQQPADSAAATVLQEVWQRMALDNRIRQLYVHPQQVAVVASSLHAFTTLAARQQADLGSFASQLGASEARLGKRRSKLPTILIERIENAKGQEFDHVILPFLEAGEFPRRDTPLADEENLFYVGITRTRDCLTLLRPATPQRHSPFIARLGLGAGLSAKADTATARLPAAAEAPPPARIDLNVPYADKDQAKALGALWDPVRRTWYLNPGVDPRPFAQWRRN